MIDKLTVRALLGLTVALGACTGAPPPVKEPVKVDKPVLEVKKALPKAKEDGPQAMTKAKMLDAFEAEATIKGADGRRCGKWRDRVVVTRPNERNEFDLRVRPDTGDLEKDCQWDGPVLVQTRVAGEVIGVVWPHVVAYAPEARRTGRIQVVQGTTGGMTGEVVNSGRPRYDRQLVLSFEVPIEFEIARSDEATCNEQIAQEWATVLADLEAGGSLHPKMAKDVPHCPPEAVDRFCDNFAFLIPHELVLTDSQARPAGGAVGCAHLPN